MNKILAAAAVAAAAAPASADLVFSNTVTGAGNNAQFTQAVAEAAQMWSDVFTDDITVNLNFNITSSGGFLAFAQSSTSIQAYSSVRTALAADATSVDDATSVASLPVGSNVGFFTFLNGSRAFDNDNTPNNQFVSVNRPSAKAAGLIAGNDAGTDGFITLNGSLNYDFDRSDGISSNALDVVGILAHEIGHALGFVSFADTLDQGGNSSTGNFSELRTLDLFRYRENSGGEIDVTPGRTGAPGAPILSADGGLTAIGEMSPGANFGSASTFDNFQASHWRNGGFPSDRSTIGIMDPQIAFGELQFIREPDLRAFDIIGFDLVAIPEPSSLTLLGLASIGLLTRRRR